MGFLCPANQYHYLLGTPLQTLTHTKAKDRAIYHGGPLQTSEQAVVASGRVLKSMQTVEQAVVASGRVLKFVQTVGQVVVASESQV